VVQFRIGREGGRSLGRERKTDIKSKEFGTGLSLLYKIWEAGKLWAGREIVDSKLGKLLQELLQARRHVNMWPQDVGRRRTKLVPRMSRAE
jgi:hypothetical protein